MNFKLLAGTGAYTIFIGRVLKRLPKLPKRWQELTIQLKRIGVDSLFLITITSIFTGLVVAVQIIYQGSYYIPKNLFSVIIGKANMIELAPVLTGLVLTGKVGASIAAEIGTMRVSEQIDALQSMSIAPEEFLYLPRISAGVISAPLLTIYADLISIIAGWFFTWMRYGIRFFNFFNDMRIYFAPFDLIGGIIKAILFGFLITSLACFFGDKTTGGAEGVGHSTMQTVVYSSVGVLVLDFLVAILMMAHYL
ncbi:MlaE family ABC transporter permease [Candidatus Syntrophosphaera thermopropionivorans]|jgi:phospholipid/cholesterol/gamma-HCH transport system permease protein|uniref:ABC transporter permease n=1 Tax=Candidatus Syntrophosphaera thermopropionivorans TaxID=2593015 RepID=A0AC61QI77_9BACT|nr:ABC transporter permease [Candidatus Syntrophosphaera thermopropionivorans]TDF72660.1 ABC transporter permease [Candidatus Syntrophosphaera thermopropionivorans]HRU47703.1 ABC transporter permease [Candidatus Syntrophosphaera sp.]